MIKQKSTARIATANDGVNIFYWHNYKFRMNKPTIVMQSGGGMNSSSFIPLERRLNEKGYPTLVIEPRGVGYSQAPAKSEFYTLEAYSKDIQRVVEREGLEKPSFFAHSFGFMPVVDYVSRTHNARSITGACVSHNFAETTFSGGIFLFTDILPILDVSASILCYLFHKLKGEQRPDYSDQSKLRGKGTIKFLSAINDIPLKHALNHFLTNEGVTRWDITEQLGKIAVPIHLIHGSEDFMVNPIAIKIIKRRASGQVTSDIISGNHALPYQKPEEVAEIIERYN